MVESGNGARMVTYSAGRPTVLDNCRAHCACSRCGLGFRLSSPFISFHID